MNKILRPTWAEIDLNALRENFKTVRAKIQPDVKVLFVTKANAYGHGMLKLAEFVQREKLCDMLGSASIEEGVELRKNGITMPILVLGSIYPFEAFETAIENDLAVTVSSVAAAKALREMADKINKPAHCHIKQDTGMGRIGTRRRNAVNILEETRPSENIIVDGFYTHLSSADTDADFTAQQLEHFETAALDSKAKGFEIPCFHACATTGILHAPRGVFDMVRIGLGAYGLHKDFKPVLSFKSKVVFIKDISKGFSVSYNRSYKAEKEMRVATVPAGYGDGYLRAAGPRGEVLINGRRLKIIGNVTMDMLMVDVNDAPEIKVGDEVVLIGAQGKHEITACDVAGWAGTIPYEVTTLITARVPRVYKDK